MYSKPKQHFQYILLLNLQVHINSQAKVPDHCVIYALSDPNEIGFKQHCDHAHDQQCERCQGLSLALEDIGQAISIAQFRSDEDRDETQYLYDTAKRAIEAWKAHQLRFVRQDQARLDVLELLSSESILIVNDWAMKFLPQLYRESQQDWFAKRGISWHIAVVFRRVNGELQSQAFIHVIQSCSQDSTAIILIIQHVLKTLKTEHPEIKQAFLRQDNAGCYHCANTVYACSIIEKSTGIKVSRLDFSDPQGGKGPADRMAATCKARIRTHINEGNDVGTAEAMRDALLSSGGIEGVRVAALPTINEGAVTELKIAGISKLNNFEFNDGNLTAWQAYGVGKGKQVAVKKSTGLCRKLVTSSF